MKKDKSNLILHDKNLIKGIFLLSFPVMLNNILKAFHDVVDTFMVSKMIDNQEKISAQIAAIGFISPIMAICQALAIGLMTAGVALMSQYLGAKKEEEASKVSGQLLLLCILVGIIFNILLYIFAPTILSLMHAEGLLFSYSLKYLQIRSFELSALFIFYAYQATRQSFGDTTTPVVINISSIFLNIGLTALFIFGFKMDISGAAWGTVIANVIIVPVCLYHMIKSSKLKLTLDTFKYNHTYCKKIFLLGAPAAIAQAFAQLGFVIMNGMQAAFDDSIIAPITIGTKINSILLFPTMGISTVLATFVGQNIGANNSKRAAQSFYNALILSVGISILGSILLYPFREQVVRIFLTEPHEVALCVEYLNYLIVGLPLMGIFQSLIGTFQGSGRTEFVLIIATIRLWLFRIPILYVMMFILDVGISAVWKCMIISNFAICILGMVLYCFIDYKPRISRINQKARQEAI